MKKSNFNKIIVIFVAVLFLASCSTMTKMVGSLAGSLMTKSTNDLNDAAIQVYFMRNVYPQETNVVETEYFGKTWHKNGNMVFVSLLNRKGMGFLTVDGTVTIDGDVVPHVKNGFYGKWIDKGDTSPKHVVIKTKTGQVAEFVVAPPEAIKIKSVNGKLKGAVINVESDLVLELESSNIKKNTEFKISLINDIMGLSAFTDVGVFKLKNKVHLPAVMWENTGAAMSPRAGKNWLKIERFNVIPTQVKGVGASQIIGMSLDTIPVTVTGKIDESFLGVSKNQGIVINEKLSAKDGDMNINISKPTAFLGRPMSSGKKFAVVSFTVRATRLQQSRTSINKIGDMVITTTETRTFPKLSDAYWNKLVNDLYMDFESVLKNNFDMNLIPVENVLKAPSYHRLEPIADKISVVEVEKSYKGTKNLIPTTLSAIISNVSTTFASDRADSRLIKELGVDGIIAVTLDLEMDWKGALSPRLSIRISGAPNGYIAGPTIYLQGLVNGKGIAWNTANMNAKSAMKALPDAIRAKDLMKSLDVAFKKMKQAEKAGPYQALWAVK